MSESRTLRIASHLARTAAIEDRIRLLSRKYKLPDMEIQRFVGLDPTPGNYLEWILRQSLQDPRVDPQDSDIHVLRESLSLFDRIKKSPALMKKLGASTDINQYDLDSLYDLAQTAVTSGLSQTNRQKGKESKSLGSSVVYNKPPAKIIEIGGPGSDLDQAAFASCLYARGTKWCTSNSAVAKTYLSKSPFYVIFVNNEKVGQYYPPSGALKDLEDLDFDLWSSEGRVAMSALLDSEIPIDGEFLDMIDKMDFPLNARREHQLEEYRDAVGSLWEGLEE